jgi:hypothetical protein
MTTLRSPELPCLGAAHDSVFLVHLGSPGIEHQSFIDHREIRKLLRPIGLADGALSFTCGSQLGEIQHKLLGCMPLGVWKVEPSRRSRPFRGMRGRGR